MSWESVVVQAITALPPTLLALAAWRSSKMNRRGISGVHRIVNSQRAAMMREITALKQEIFNLKNLPRP